MVQKPDLLLLDEPTNHLDIITIKWLESVVYSHAGSVLFITHDRAFLQRLATRIIEIDRGKSGFCTNAFACANLRRFTSKSMHMVAGISSNALTPQ